MASLPQQHVAATLEATLFSANLSQLAPGFFQDIQPVLETFRVALTAAEIALEILIALSALAVFVADLPDALDAAVLILSNALLAVVASKIDDLRNTGFSVLILPIAPGGMAGAAKTLRAALLNARDPKRPAFGPLSFLAGWGIIAAAPIEQIQAVFDAITQLVLLGQGGLQSGIVNAKPANVFFDPFAANKVAGSARPLNLPPWMALRIVDFVPGSEDALGALAAWLRSMITPVYVPPIVDYTNFVKALFDRIIAMIALIETVIALLLSIFSDVPCKIVEFDAQVGSTQDLVDSIPRWFDPGSPILSDVPAGDYTCGLFAVSGSVDPVTPSAAMSLLRDLFLPTPDPTPA